MTGHAPLYSACGSLLEDESHRRAAGDGGRWNGDQRSRGGAEGVLAEVCWYLWRRREKAPPKNSGTFQR